MKAVVHTAYGSADLLELRELAQPTPGLGEILVRVRATTVSSGDCNMRNLTFVSPSMRPIAKLIFGIRRPRKATVLGTQLAGEVVEVGSGVTQFAPGDAVFASTGAKGGGHAEYACLPETGPVERMPVNLSFAEAAAIPFGADAALYYLRDLGNLQPGKELLILGASGSIGTAAVQLGMHFGARVTGVCSGKNAELVRSLGADEVIDYTREDFTANGRTYDIILDCIAVSSFAKCKASLKDKGIYMPCIMSVADMAVRMPWTALTGGKRLKGAVVLETAERMREISALASAGYLQPVIDRSYPLEEIAQAYKYVETGRKRGSVVIDIVNSQARAS